jgi:hypothetical protein
MSKNNPLTVLVPRKDYHLSSSSSDSSLDTQPDAPRKSVSTLLKERKDKINAAVDARNNALKARVAGSKKNGQASVKANLSNGMSTPTNAFTTVRHASKRAPPLDTAWVSTASKKPKTHKEWHPVPSDFRPPYGYKLVPDEMCPSPLFKTNKYDRKRPPLSKPITQSTKSTLHDPSGVLYTRQEEVLAAIDSNKSEVSSSPIRKALAPTFNTVALTSDKNKSKTLPLTKNQEPPMQSIVAIKKEKNTALVKEESCKTIGPAVIRNNQKRTNVKIESKSNFKLPVLWKTDQPPFDPKTTIPNEWTGQGGTGLYRSGRNPFYTTASIDRVLRCVGCGGYSCPNRLGMYIAYKNAQQIGLVNRIYDTPAMLENNKKRRQRMFFLSCTALSLDCTTAAPIDCCVRLCDAIYPESSNPIYAVHTYPVVASVAPPVLTINDDGNDSETTVEP